MSMKKFLVLFAVALILIGVGIKDDGLINLMDDRADSTYTFYLGKSSTDWRGLVSESVLIGDSVSVIDNGFNVMVSCDGEVVKVLKSKLNGVNGQSVKFVGEQYEIDDIIKKYRIVVTDRAEIDDMVTVYGYSKWLNSSGVIVDGHRVNVQIAYRNGMVTVGMPLIFGSY